MSGSTYPRTDTEEKSGNAENSVEVGKYLERFGVETLDKINELIHKNNISDNGKSSTDLSKPESNKASDSAAGSNITTQVGKNSVTWKLDSTGNTISASGSLRESFSGVKRSSAEVQAQSDAAAAAGMSGDHGGHLVAHRFVLDQGSVNLFPQEGNFNMSAFKTLENDYARYTAQGYQVDFIHNLGNFDPLTGRPGTLTVQCEVTDTNGNLIDAFSAKFLNQPSQTYIRRAP